MRTQGQGNVIPRIGEGIFIVPHLAALRARLGVDGDWAQALSASTPANGNGGFFYAETGTFDPETGDDNLNTIVHPSGTVRWLRAPAAGTLGVTSLNDWILYETDTQSFAASEINGTTFIFRRRNVIVTLDESLVLNAVLFQHQGVHSMKVINQADYTFSLGTQYWPDGEAYVPTEAAGEVNGQDILTFNASSSPPWVSYQQNFIVPP